MKNDKQEAFTESLMEIMKREEEGVFMDKNDMLEEGRLRDKGTSFVVMEHAWKDMEKDIIDIPKFTKKNSLDNTRLWLERLGNPSVNKKIIHVAGTNGKGSVCSYLNALFLSDGNTVGMFTSPHLVELNERVRVNGKVIDKMCFLQAYYELKKVIADELAMGNARGNELAHPTFFEFLFLLAMIVFERQKVDVVILETGLGGRLDATNVISKPWLTVITEIGMDHMQYLGDTKAQIAVEKAGIIKPFVPVVYADRARECTEVIEKQAKLMNSFSYPVASTDCICQNLRNKSIDFSYKSSYYGYVRLHLQTTAVYQIENASLALRAYEVLKQGNWDVEKVRETLKCVCWEGRMEEILPDVYVDGAHNEDGIKAFLETVKLDKRKKKRVLLFSVVQDKAYEKMICEIVEAGLFHQYIVVHMPEERCASTEQLQKIFGRYKDMDVFYADTVEEGLELSVGKKTESDIVYIAGSLYLVGFVKAILGRNKND